VPWWKVVTSGALRPQDDVQLACQQELHVNVGVSYGVRALLDVAYVDTVNDKGGGEPQPFEETLRFEISKSEPRLVYSLRYLHTVSAILHKKLITTPAFRGDEIASPRRSYGITIDI
jgi:hypothetical protein